MSEKEFNEIKSLMLGLEKCKTKSHLKLAIAMILAALKEHVKP
jgi:hypothetical protein